MARKKLWTLNNSFLVYDITNQMQTLAQTRMHFHDYSGVIQIAAIDVLLL